VATVVLCEEGATGAVDIRGNASGNERDDALGHVHLVEKIHAIFLSGGSAFGLDAAAGSWFTLRREGKLRCCETRVPIVPAAIIFDFGIGDYRVRPDREWGMRHA